MPNYYFTFGQAHFTQDGHCMKYCYVKVTAPDWGSARTHFCEHFATPIMGKADKWAFQYEEDDFKTEYFPMREYDHLAMPDFVAGSGTPV